jgi:hypothetical protein
MSGAFAPGEPLRDHLGQQISVGDIIAYPVRRSSNLSLSVSLVERIEWKTPEYGYRREPFPVLHIVGVSMPLFGEEKPESWALYRRPVTELSRVMRVHPETVRDNPTLRWLVEQTQAKAE